MSKFAPIIFFIHHGGTKNTLKKYSVALALRAHESDRSDSLRIPSNKKKTIPIGMVFDYIVRCIIYDGNGC